MTPDLPTRVREAFEAAIDASSPAIRDEGEALDFALAAVIAVVQEDRTREIVAAMRARHSAVINATADAIEREFGGTTHD